MSWKADKIEGQGAENGKVQNCEILIDILIYITSNFCFRMCSVYVFM